MEVFIALPAGTFEVTDVEGKTVQLKPPTIRRRILRWSHTQSIKAVYSTLPDDEYPMPPRDVDIQEFKDFLVLNVNRDHADVLVRLKAWLVAILPVDRSSPLFEKLPSDVQEYVLGGAGVG